MSSYSTSNIVGRTMLQNLESIKGPLALASERISSGKKINRAADDPSGLNLVKQFESHIRGLEEAIGSIQKRCSEAGL